MNAEIGPRLCGAPNFRDIGGCSAADGARLRGGQLFRSEILQRLDDADLEILASAGSSVCADVCWSNDRG